MTRSHRGSDVRLEGSRFYWALLRIPSGTRIRGHGDRIAILANLFETHLPIPVEKVQATYISVSGESTPGCFIACGVDVSLLEALTSDDPTSLGPDSIPLSDLGLDPGTCPLDAAQINLLHGRFRPRSVRRAHRRLLAGAGVFALLLSSLLSVGIERRVHQHRAEIRAIAREIESLAPSEGQGAARLPAIMRLTARLRAAEALERSAPELRPPEDAALHLASILERWKPIEGVHLDSLRVEGGTMHASFLMPSPDTAPVLLSHLASDGAWVAAQPTLTQESTGIRARVSLRAASSASGEPP